MGCRPCQAKAAARAAAREAGGPPPVATYSLTVDGVETTYDTLIAARVAKRDAGGGTIRAIRA